MTAAGRPAVLVPYPHATADHQTANAAWMAGAGAAVTIEDADLDPDRLATEIGTLLGDEARLAAMARASRSLAKPDAARDIADRVLAARPAPREDGVPKVTYILEEAHHTLKNFCSVISTRPMRALSSV